MKNHLILETLKTDKENSFKLIYEKYYGLIEYHVLRNSGDSDDAKDLFQDVMIVLVQKLERDDFVLSAKLKTYIMAIAKNLWLKKLRDSGKNVSWNYKHENNLFEEMQSSIERETTYTDRLQQLFHKMTDHCHKLLDDIYYKMKSILDIQKDYGYSSKHNAQNQKHKCVQQLRQLKDQS